MSALTLSYACTAKGWERRGTPPAAGGGGGDGVVLLKSNWDALDVGAMTSAKWDAIFGAGMTVVDKANAVARSELLADLDHGGNLYRQRLLANTTGTKNGSTAIVALPRTVEAVTWEYMFRFVGAFAPFAGGKLPGPSGVVPGINPGFPAGGNFGGDSGCSMRNMWLGNTGDGNVPDFTGTDYVYGKDQVSQYGDHVRFTPGGVGTTPTVVYAPNVWYTIKSHIRLNNPTAADGVLRTWRDGALVVDRANRRYRSTAALRLTHLMWSIFRGGSTAAWQSPNDDYIDIGWFRLTEGLV